jgi:hypothetical protein
MRVNHGMVHWSYKPSKEKRTTRISGPVFSKLALMHTVYEGISTQEEMLFNCGEMVCWSNIFCQVLDLLYLHTPMQQRFMLNRPPF